MRISFTKMHGLGNDFVLIDATSKTVELSARQVRFIADRRLGIGCDQVLLVEKSDVAAADFRYRIYNADGAEVEQCGNGARCLARYLRDAGLTEKNAIAIHTAAGMIDLHVEQNGDIRVNMGVPRLQPSAIPFIAPAVAPSYRVEVGGTRVDLGAVSMGNPHAVLQVADVGAAAVTELGSLLQRHTCFPQQVNVGFMQIIDRNRIRLRVYERGVGETLACGTGACAAVVVGRVQGLLDADVRVALSGGELAIRWAGGAEPVWMSGPATSVFTGIVDV